jgi:hypothetical protein
MGQAGPAMITGGGQKDLSFMFQVAEGTRVNDPIAIPLKGSA